MNDKKYFSKIYADAKAKIFKRDSEINVFVGLGTCGAAAGAESLLSILNEQIKTRRLNVTIVKTGCIGMCEMEPLIDVATPGSSRIIYGKVTEESLMTIIDQHIIGGAPVKDLALAQHD